MHRPHCAPLLLLAALSWTGAACSSQTPDPRTERTIPRETFINAYIELRTASLNAPDQGLFLAERERILARLGLGEDDLLTFAEVWGPDIEFMKAVWMEVDSIYRTNRLEPGGPGERGGSR